MVNNRSQARCAVRQANSDFVCLRRHGTGAGRLMAMNGQEDRPRWAISGAPRSEKTDSSELLFWPGALFGTSPF